MGRFLYGEHRDHRRELVVEDYAALERKWWLRRGSQVRTGGGRLDAARRRISEQNPGLQGTGHLVDRTLQGVVQIQNKKEE